MSYDFAIHADDILVGWPDAEIFKGESYKVPEGMQAIGVWWA